MAPMANPKRNIAAWGRPALLAIWILIVCWLALKHVFWRDEVRAMSLALHASGVGSVLKGLGDGHPPLWYLLIRGFHALVPQPESLQILATTIGVAAAALFALRSPFGILLTALVLFSRFTLYEYSVMARNYGISMLILFLLAMLYEKWRDRGIILGLLLFLLADCNAHSILLAAAFLLFWLGDIILDTNRDRGTALRIFAMNAVIAAIGIAYAFLTLRHTMNDSIVSWRFESPAGMMNAVFFPAVSFAAVAGAELLVEVLQGTSAYVPWLIWSLVMSLIMFASILGLSARPAAMVASLFALLAMSLFFTIVYPGSYRHQCLWLVFLLCMYWIAGQRHKQSPHSDAPPSPRRTARMVGFAALVALLCVQLVTGLQKLAQAASDRPESQSKALNALIEETPALRDAIIIADPDYLVESLPYYVSNRTYLTREQRFGDVTWFTKKARKNLTLEDILENANRLRDDFKVQVIILLKQRLDPLPSVRTVDEGYDWHLSVEPEQARRFLASTRLIQPADPGVTSDEKYDVYLLK
jgi:hypothetical protein